MIAETCLINVLKLLKEQINILEKVLLVKGDHFAN